MTLSESAWWLLDLHTQEERSSKARVVTAALSASDTTPWPLCRVERVAWDGPRFAERVYVGAEAARAVQLRRAREGGARDRVVAGLSWVASLRTSPLHAGTYWCAHTSGLVERGPMLGPMRAGVVPEARVVIERGVPVSMDGGEVDEGGRAWITPGPVLQVVRRRAAP